MNTYEYHTVKEQILDRYQEETLPTPEYETVENALNEALYAERTTTVMIEMIAAELAVEEDAEKKKIHMDDLRVLNDSLKVISESRSKLSEAKLAAEKASEEQKLAIAKYKTDYELSLKESRSTVISAALNAAGKILGEVAGATIRSRSVHKLYEKDRLFEEEHIFSRSRTDATKRLF